MITEKPNLVLIDYENKETWFNSPAPVDVSHIQSELTRVGGLIPPGYGEMSGKPNFLIVWGQTHQVWLNGKKRLMFDDEILDAKHFPNHFAVTEAVYQRAINWYLAAEEKRKEAWLECNFAGAQNFPDFAKYLEQHESTLDYFRLLPDANPAQIARMLPDGYRYLCGLWSYEEIGKQQFFVVQWESPEMLGDEADWNEIRWQYVYYPETDSDTSLIDVLGEYPRNGQHSLPVLRIADRISDKVWQYREPTIENVILPMRQMLEIRDRLSKYEKSPEFQHNLRVEKLHREQRNRKSEFNYKFNQAKPVGKGNPTNVPTVKVRDGLTKHGKGKKIEI